MINTLHVLRTVAGGERIKQMGGKYFELIGAGHDAMVTQPAPIALTAVAVTSTSFGAGAGAGSGAASQPTSAARAAVASQNGA